MSTLWRLSSAFCAQANLFLQVVANLILDAVIAGLATALSGAFVLPTLAGDEVRGSIAATLMGLGQSISGCAAQATSCLFVIYPFLTSTRGSKYTYLVYFRALCKRRISAFIAVIVPTASSCCETL